MESIDLCGVWQLIERSSEDGVEAAQQVATTATELAGQVPGDVNDCLVRAGRLPEPLVGVNFRQFDWVRHRSWWYRRTVHVPAAWADRAAVELSLDGLDVHADVWLNGEHLGHHPSAFYPFQRDVKSHLHFGGENTLLVRLTCGQERVTKFADDPLCQHVPSEAPRGYLDRALPARIYLRKPAYTWGWDWNPPLATCGMTGPAMLCAMNTAEIADVTAVTHLHGNNNAMVRVTVALDYHTAIDSARADLHVTMTDRDGASFSAAASQQSICSGINHIQLDVPITGVRLWWPNGSGDPHLYTLRVGGAVDGQPLDGRSIRYGVRTIELDTAPGRFAVVVNGRPLFVQGGNWVPSDALYGRITDEKLRMLVDEGAAAHFNCLRVWGGGRFEADAFYDACDERGILLWHDFMSACAPLPADQPGFAATFEAEADYQIRRLRNRPCLMLWCGNNEVSQQMAGQFDDPGWKLYHRMLPQLVRQLCPHIPYRPTSPYGGKGTVHDPREGDAHHWLVMRPEPEYWSNPWYWDGEDVPIFNSEYGYGGPCCLTSTRQYTGMQRPDLSSEVGREHTNTFYDIPRVNFSIAEHYCDPQDLPLEMYILLGGLCQGLDLGYSLESMRANRQTMGGIFWMFNDSWGENGWTIVDYYLRRKCSFYAVKRALRPMRLVLRRGGQAFGGDDDEVVLLVVNDSPRPLVASCRLGYIRYDGSAADLHPVQIDVPPFEHAIVGRVAAPDAQQLQHGTVAAIPDGSSPLDSAHWLRRTFRKAEYPQPKLTIEHVERTGDDLRVTVSADRFAHAVHLCVDDDVRLSDQYFDLLPGERRTIIAFGQARQINEPPVACVQWENDGRCAIARFTRWAWHRLPAAGA